MKRIPLVMLAAALTAACASPSPEAAPAAPGAAPAVPGTATAATNGSDCGTFVLKQGEVVAAGPANCLIDAAEAGRVATLTVTSPTTEGDPIAVTFGSRTDGRIDVTTDSRQDNFGEQIISRETCSTAAYDATAGITISECDPPLRVEE